ncbi:MAG: Gfo/Idh/MocA family oxidoreductase, partial [Verrucomicrobiota bacterium]
MKPTTIAVIGSGYWGRNLVRNFGQLGALGWVCDAHLEVARAHAEMWEGARHTSSFDEILEDVETPAVAIASPARLHFEHAKAALESNKHVFVEKPLALNLSEGEKLVALAEEKNRVLMVGHILRYHPAVIKLRELIES